MTPEQRIFGILCACFGLGLTLIAYGLGGFNRPAAVGVGLVLCVAAIAAVSGGRGQR